MFFQVCRRLAQKLALMLGQTDHIHPLPSLPSLFLFYSLCLPFSLPPLFSFLLPLHVKHLLSYYAGCWKYYSEEDIV